MARALLSLVVAALLLLAAPALGAQGPRKLKSSNFDTVLAKYDSAVVMFYAPWCGHCKRFKPVFSEAARELSKPKEVLFALVNADKEKDIAMRFGISGYPTIMHISKEREVRDISYARSTLALQRVVEGDYRDVQPMAAWQSPMGTFGDARTFVSQLARQAAEIPKPIADLLGVPEVAVQFSLLMGTLMLLALSVIVMAWCCSTRDTPQYRAHFHED